MDASADRWHSILAETRRQVSTRPSTGSDWWDVAEGAPAASLPSSTLPTTASAPPSTLLTPARWRQEEWHIAFTILFFEAPAGAWDGGDDILFFVLADHAWNGKGGGGFSVGQPARRGAAPPSTPLLVRRRGPAPPPGLGLGGEDARNIDWAATVSLNLAAQGRYRLGLVACPRPALSGLGVPAVLAGEAAAVPPSFADAGARLRSHAVHATPMRVGVEVGGRGNGGGGGGGGGRTVGGPAAPARPAPSSAAPEVSYPDVCFEVAAAAGHDGGPPSPSSAGHSSLILEKPGDAFAVFLISLGGPGPGAGEMEERTSPPASPPPPPPFTELFAGYVTYEQLVGALVGRGGSGKGRGFLNPAAAPSTEHVRMRGPGGAGCADVAVTVLPPAGGAASGPGPHPLPPPPPPPSPPASGLGAFLHRAAAAALGPPPPPHPPGPPRFACSLYRLSLPVGELTFRLCAE